MLFRSAPLIQLSYGRMVWMALPYTIVLALVGFLGIVFFLEPMTTMFYDLGWITHGTIESATSAVSSGH